MDITITINVDGQEVAKYKVEPKKLTEVKTQKNFSQYARFFDESSPNWVKDPEYNLMFLRQQQQYANDRLKSVGHLFLNEVYDMLGIPRSKEGQVVGWIYDEENLIGDNFVDFGIFNPDSVGNREFVNGYVKAVLLDFNVDGNIWEVMESKES